MNEELAQRFGCAYGKDAQEAVEICNELLRKTKTGRLTPGLVSIRFKVTNN